MPKTYTAAVIGSTGKGGYGHRLDSAFNIDGVELVAIADHDPEGLADAGERLKRVPSLPRLPADA